MGWNLHCPSAEKKKKQYWWLIVHSHKRGREAEKKWQSKVETHMTYAVLPAVLGRYLSGGCDHRSSTLWVKNRSTHQTLKIFQWALSWDILMCNLTSFHNVRGVVQSLLVIIIAMENDIS